MNDVLFSVGASLDSEGKLEKIVAKIYYIDAQFEQLKKINLEFCGQGGEKLR